MGLLQEILTEFPTDPLELAGLVSGLLCVYLLIKENIWVWPVGFFYACVSVFVFFEERLFASMLESIYYMAMNAYGWYFWKRGQGDRRSDEELKVVFMPKSAWVPILLLLIAGSFLMGWLLSRYTSAALPFWDGGSMWVAFVAMWMSARKWIENWILWLAVDVVKTGVYISQGIELYAVLYGVYIVMAFWGWAAWKRAMSEERS